MKSYIRYSRNVSKKLIEIDDNLLDEARTILGTSTQRETVTRALDEVVRRRRRQDFTELLTSGQLDLADTEVMGGAWRA
jgi:Arc/MetJ family transcription regulator